jgi:hypothetical protein
LAPRKGRSVIVTPEVFRLANANLKASWVNYSYFYLFLAQQKLILPVKLISIENSSSSKAFALEVARDS